MASSTALDWSYHFIVSDNVLPRIMIRMKLSNFYELQILIMLSLNFYCVNGVEILGLAE